MTYIIISFSVERWMATAHKKAERKKKKRLLDIGHAAVYLLVESPGIQIRSLWLTSNIYATSQPQILLSRSQRRLRKQTQREANVPWMPPGLLQLKKGRLKSLPFSVPSPSRVSHGQWAVHLVPEKKRSVKKHAVCSHIARAIACLQNLTVSCVMVTQEIQNLFLSSEWILMAQLQNQDAAI